MNSPSIQQTTVANDITTLLHHIASMGGWAGIGQTIWLTLAIPASGGLSLDVLRGVGRWSTRSTRRQPLLLCARKGIGFGLRALPWTVGFFLFVWLFYNHPIVLVAVAFLTGNGQEARKEAVQQGVMPEHLVDRLIAAIEGYGRRDVERVHAAVATAAARPQGWAASSRAWLAKVSRAGDGLPDPDCGLCGGDGDWAGHACPCVKR